MKLHAPPATGGTERGAPTGCLTKSTLAEYLAVSTRTVDRAAACGRLPTPDLIVGRSPRWSMATVDAWLATRPRLPGRGGE